MTDKIIRRQELSTYYARNGATIYITRSNILLKEKRIFGEKCLTYYTKKEQSVDINDYYDWRIAEMLIKHLETK